MAGKASSMVVLWGSIGIGRIGVMVAIDMLVARAL